MENHAALQEVEIACPEGDNLNGDAKLAAIDAALQDSLNKLEQAIQEWVKDAWSPRYDEETDTSGIPSRVF